MGGWVGGVQSTYLEGSPGQQSRGLIRRATTNHRPIIHRAIVPPIFRGPTGGKAVFLAPHPFQAEVVTWARNHEFRHGVREPDAYMKGLYGFGGLRCCCCCC